MIRIITKFIDRLATSLKIGRIKMKNFKYHDKNSSNKKEKKENADPNQTGDQPQKVFLTIEPNFMFLTGHFGNGIELINSKYSIGQNNTQIGISFIQTISDKKLIDKQIIEPLLKTTTIVDSPAQTYVLLKSKLIYIPGIRDESSLDQIIIALLNGDTIIFIDGFDKALIINSRKIEARSVEMPNNEVTTLSSADSFTESLPANCNMIIRRLKTPDLRIETFTAGKLSRTEIKLIYINGICKQTVVDEVKKRIQNVDVDIIDGIGQLSRMIEDNPYSIFPKTKQTQRPDVTVKYLSEGSFALLCSNSPFSMIAPVTFFDNLKSMDDYAENTYSATYLRTIRLLAFILSITISPLYLSFVAYNHSIVPPALAVNITAGREGVPFPSVIEIIALTVSITIIREASLRIPGTVGYFIGSLAAVVLGQATVMAGYVSASVIIVVALSTTASFAITSTSLLFPSRMLNYFLILLAAIFGTFGVLDGLILILWHMLSQESFGVPYLYPMVPIDLEAGKDTILRAPFSLLRKRFRMFVEKNDTKIGEKGIKHKK